MLSTLCAAAALTLSLPSPAPDVIPSGRHAVPVDRSVEIDPLRDVCCVQYVVKAGDTLVKIAEAHLGDPKRHREIEALNPGIEPTRLRVGQRIWLPPRQTDLEGTRRFVYFSGRMGLVDAAPYEGGRPFYARHGRFTLALIPEELLTDFEAAQEAGEVDFYAEDHGIEFFTGRAVGRFVEDGSKVARMTEVQRVVRGEDGRFWVESEVAYFDKEGRRLRADGNPVGEEDRDDDAAWILLLAAGGAALVWWRVRARSFATVPAAATA